MISKYNTSRKFIRMSWNKYNLFNAIKYARQKRKIYFKPKKLRIRSLIYKNKLIAKQRLRGYYGNLSEIELKKLLKLAAWGRNKFYKTFKSRPLQDYLLLNLERRLDTVLFRLGWVPSIFTSRQLINHGHILVNGKQIRSCGYLLSVNDLVHINHKSIKFVKNLKRKYTNSLIQKRLKKYRFKNKSINSMFPKPPKYFITNKRKLSAILIYLPNVKKIRYPFNIKSSLVSRFYKKVRY